jgi:hypothetical protein
MKILGRESVSSTTELELETKEKHTLEGGVGGTFGNTPDSAHASGHLSIGGKLLLGGSACLHLNESFSRSIELDGLRLYTVFHHRQTPPGRFFSSGGFSTVVQLFTHATKYMCGILAGLH